ncbi:hypothetical protein D3C76_1146640 [compost metagenome]
MVGLVERNCSIGLLKALFQYWSKPCPNCSATGPTLSMSMSVKFLLGSASKYSSPKLRPPTIATLLSASHNLLCMRRCCCDRLNSRPIVRVTTVLRPRCSGLNTRI